LREVDRLNTMLSSLLVYGRPQPLRLTIGNPDAVWDDVIESNRARMDDAGIESVVKTVRPDFLQLHGHESVQRTAEIRARFDVAVIKALPVAEASDFDVVAAYEKYADMLMFDARPPKGADRAGGHGAAFDWKLLAGRSFTKPWFLAGGLNPDNVARAVELSGATLVDVSSGVESAPGVKDAARIADFVTAAKSPVSLSKQSA
ncbi:MAG: phosphoribosylanthranilate isomerase, partial [Pseudomonadota bacterium]